MMVLKRHTTIQQAYKALGSCTHLHMHTREDHKGRSLQVSSKLMLDGMTF